jgi:DnaJ-class molecular chaperone
MALGDSNYQRLKDELEALKCTKCHGSGKVDDAEPGDISFNEYTCPRCGGTGLKDGVEAKLRECYE